MADETTYETIERELHIDASPEVVFDVVSSPEHLKQWWPDDARYDPVPGAVGEIVFGVDHEATVVPFNVVHADPPHRFSFRWAPAEGESVQHGRALLVTFALTPSGTGTTLRMTETGFADMGWDVAELERQYLDHVDGWAFYLPRLAPCVERLVRRVPQAGA